MPVDCDAAWDWLAAQGTGTPDISPEITAQHAAHLARCAACRAVQSRYEVFLQQAQRLAAYAPHTEAEDRYLLAVSDAMAASPTTPEALRAALQHQPSASSAEAFLKAARLQAKSAPTQPKSVPAEAKPVPTQAKAALTPRSPWPMVLALAAVLLLAVGGWWASQTVTSPSEQTHSSDLVAAEQTAPPQPPAGAVPRPLHAQTVLGEVRVDGVVLSADQRPVLSSGHQIQTGASGQFTFGNPTNATVKADANTHVQVVAWNPTLTQLDLTTGTVHAEVVHREADETFEGRTANARVVVVGTTFSVSYSELGGTVVRGTSGKVRVERHNGTLVGVVTAGGMLHIEPTADTPEDTLVGSASGTTGAEEPTRHTAPAHNDASTRPAQSTGQEAAARPAHSPEVSEEAKPALLRAAELLARGDEAQAIALLEGTPATDWQRDALLGDAYQLSGQVEAAEAAYLRAIALTQSPPETLLADLANLQTRGQAHSAAASATWRLYLTLHPTGTSALRAHFSLAASAASVGNTAESETHLRQVLTQFPDKPERDTAMLMLGSQLLQQQRWEDAEALFSNEIDGRSDAAEAALVGLIRVRIAQGQAALAEGLLEDYWLGYPQAKRAEEVRRLEQALEASR